MAIAFAVGNVLVPQVELEAREASGDLRRLRTGSGGVLDFREGSVSAAEVDAMLEAGSDPATGFTRIGVGKPLSLEIFTVYSGDAPGRRFPLFSRRPDLLVLSGVKEISAFDMAARAINQMVSKVNDHRIYEPSAFAEGSPVVYYTPALTSGSLTTSFHMVVDSFDRRALDQIAGLLSSAGALPIFAPAATYLMAGSIITKMAGRLGDAFAETAPYLQDDFTLHLSAPGAIPEVARNLVIFDADDLDELTAYRVEVVDAGPGGRRRWVLVHRQTGETYRGDAPYMIVSMDGRKRDADLGDFAPAFATAALLSRFYGSGEPGGDSLDVLKDALSLYNDLTFRKKADAVRAELQRMADTSSDEYRTLLARFNAYRSNIRHDLLQVEEIAPAPAGGAWP